MFGITLALERIKGTVTDIIPEELILELCREVGHYWRNRDESMNRRVDVTEFVAWAKACAVDPQAAFVRFLESS